MPADSSCSDALPLAGASVVVTRPAESAQALVRCIRRLGGAPIRLPGLGVRGPVDPEGPRNLLRAAFDDWIFVSPLAVQRAARLAAPLRLPHGARAFGVGRGTQRALARLGIHACIPVERADSEGLLDCAELAQVDGRRVALVGAPGGRGLLAPALRARGAEVEPIHVYQRTAPRLTRRHFAALAEAGGPLFVLLSSGEALANLVALLPPDVLARLREATLVVASERLAAAGRDAGFADVVVAASAVSAALLATTVACVAGRNWASMRG